MRSCANRLQESGVILCSTLYNRPFARWRHFTVYNQNPSEFCFLVQIRAFSDSKLTGIIKFNNERENEMNSALSSKKKSSCKWPIMKKMYSPLSRWVGVRVEIFRVLVVYHFQKVPENLVGKQMAHDFLGRLSKKKISGGNGTSEKLVVFFQTE